MIPSQKHHELGETRQADDKLCGHRLYRQQLAVLSGLAGNVRREVATC